MGHAPAVKMRARGAACILTDGDEAGDALEVRERWPQLRDIASSIRACRTLDEAELAVKLERDFRSDPSILQDIDFRTLRSRLSLEVRGRLDRGVSEDVLSAEQVADMHVRLEKVERALGDIVPRYNDTRPGAVAEAVPKLRRAINQARELPLAVELPRPRLREPADLQEAFRESQNIATAVKEVWSRLTDAGGLAQEEQLAALQKESKALLGIRAEAIKLRAGIRLVQHQKDLKRPLLIRYDSEALLEETRQADGSLMRLQIELSLKASLLEMERIFLVLRAELLSGSTLTNELLPLVDSYSWLEQELVAMARLVQADDGHAQVDLERLRLLERQIGELILQLGLEGTSQEAVSWNSKREALLVNLNKAAVGVSFYGRGLALFGKDVQLLFSMLSRAAFQGYTLRAREVKLLRRIAKDVLTIVPFVVILLIPLTPLGHVLVFSFIQRFFPDFFPSQFTESRQKIMSMYSSITTKEGGADDAYLDDVSAQETRL